MAAALLGFVVAPAAACWEAAQVNVERQMAQTSKWGAARVMGGRAESFVGAQNPRVWVDVEFVDRFGGVLEAGTFSYTGRLSTSPQFETGHYYVVLLKEGDVGLQLIEQAMSVFPIENLTPGALSPWDAVQFDDGHRFIPPGASKPVTDAQLFEVLDELTVVETRVKKAGGAP